MKSIVYSILLLTGLSLLGACSNGDYVANPASNVNGGINPLHPLTSGDFTWSGTNPMSASIDGSSWVATSATYSFNSGTNTITGINGNKALVLILKDIYKNNLYGMGYKQYTTWAYWTDSLGNPDYYQSGAGNSGEVWITESDSAYVKGEFYFQAINNEGAIVNVLNGYFYVPKM